MNSETLADIVAEMRNCQLASVTKVEKYNKDQCFGCDSHPACAEVAEFADRIEAAAEREREMAKGLSKELDANRSIPGAIAAMREALSDACYAMFNFLKAQNGSYEEMANALDKAKAALAAPPRNCDVGTAEEQWDRFSKHCRSHDFCSNCPVKPLWNFEKGRKPSCGLLWAQMPYEAEGGAR